MTTMQIDDCGICFERWRCEGDHQICCLPCGHVFCLSCITRWLQQSGEVAECLNPKCRMQFRSRDVRKIYGSPVVVLDEDLQDRNQHLEENNMHLKNERDNLLKENTKLKKQMNIHGAK